MWYIARKEVCVGTNHPYREAAQGLCRRQGARRSLNNVDLSIERGEFCCIVGQSGSGKSTLLNQLAGLEKPTSGKVYIGKHEISKMTENELAEVPPAAPGVHFSELQPAAHHDGGGERRPAADVQGVWTKDPSGPRARKELKSMGLLGRANRLPTEMSGGQQQRVGIARAFVQQSQGHFCR